jgi:PAS domain S-box-containing protein
MMEQTNFKSLFENAPGLYLVLLPNLEIVAVSDEYLLATMTQRDEITGKYLFDVFPDNPDDPHADGVSNLRASLNYVIQHKQTHVMDIQKYDIRRNDGTFEARFWSPLNKPVLGSDGELQYIIHSVKDVSRQENAEIGRRKTDVLFQASIESLTDMIILFIDKDYRYIDFNSTHQKATRAVYGVDIEKGMSMFDHITNEDDRAKVRANFGRAFKGESHITTEEFGEIEKLYFETRYNPIINDKGEVIGATAFAINVSQRKKAEDELLAANEFLDVILENIPNMLFVKNASDLRFIRMNSAGERILGMKREELVGKNDYDFFAKNEADFFIKKDLEVIETGELVDIPEEKITTSKGLRWLHTKKIPILDKNGKPLYLLGISEDITTKKDAQEEMVKINEKLAAANIELEAFSYSVSHDLKAPLRSLQGFSKALFETYADKFDGDGKRWLEFISSNSQRMGALIDDILHFSKVNRTDVRLEDVNMTDLFYEVFQMEKMLYPDKYIEFELAQLQNVSGDQAMLRQVCQNLLSNALKYSSKKERISIKVDGYTENGYQIYSVTDNGVGFDERYKDKMFLAFQRLHSNDEFEGTGVGLAIVQKILQKHGGLIVATSDPGKGAKFSFAIPI